MDRQAEREAETGQASGVPRGCGWPRYRRKRARALEKRKCEFLERRFDLEEVVISRPGLYLGRRSDDRRRGMTA